MLLLCFSGAFAQTDTAITGEKLPIRRALKVDTTKQLDVGDIITRILGSKGIMDELERPKKIDFSIIPSASYSLTSGFAVDLTSNIAFYTMANHQQNLSQIDYDLSYDSKNQQVFSVLSEVWMGSNGYKLVTDIRLEKFPEETYGLGTLSTEKQANQLDFKYVRTYITVFKKLVTDYYFGGGYNLDDHFDITEKINQNYPISDFQKYGFAGRSVSSGINLDFLYDSRKNPINPLGGGYTSIIYRQNYKIIGSDNNWNSLQIDVRRYLKVSSATNNILAVWGLAWFSRGGTAYLDLPGTGLDMFNNSGRGYVDGRFIGKNMLYLESEYRFGITPNGLLGGVLFANAETLSELDNSFKRIAPAAGLGLRIKVNKYSNTNVCIDYAYGAYHSNGFFLNLGEAF